MFILFKVYIFFFLFHFIRNNPTKIFEGNVSGIPYQIGSTKDFYIFTENNSHWKYTYSQSTTESFTLDVKPNTIDYIDISPDGNTICYLRENTDCDNVYFIDTNSTKCLGTYSFNV